jgi:Holliday junction resolvasome RuvABC endonuclease subunit
MTLSLDPSIRAYGWAVLDGNKIIDLGCSPSKLGENDITVIARHVEILNALVKKYPIEHICFECSVGSQSNKAAQALAHSKALTVAIAQIHQIPFSYFYAKEIKTLLTGNSDASKEDICKEIRKKFKSFDKKTKDWPIFKVYAASDAIAVYVKFKENNV